MRRLSYSLSPPALLRLWRARPSERCSDPHVRPIMSNSPALTQMFADGDRTSRQRSSLAHRFDLRRLPPRCYPGLPLALAAPRENMPFRGHGRSC
jgi:hypothetical protein